MKNLSEYYFSLLQYYDELDKVQEKIYYLKDNEEEVNEIIKNFENKWKKFLEDSDISKRVYKKQYSKLFFSEREMIEEAIKNIY